MNRNFALTAAACLLAMAGTARAQHVCNFSTTNNYSCVFEIPMNTWSGGTVSIPSYQSGAGIAYVFETSNIDYGDWNDPIITTNPSTGTPVTLADAEYVNGQARFTCHVATGRSCPSSIRVKPNALNNKPVRLTIHRINN